MIAQSGRLNNSVLNDNQGLGHDLVNPDFSKEEKKRLVRTKLVDPLIEKCTEMQLFLNDELLDSLVTFDWKPDDFEFGKANKGMAQPPS